MALVTEPNEIAAVAAAIAKAPLVTFDLEFVSQDRLVPILALLQISWLDELDASTQAIVAAVPQIRLVDPIVGDAGPIARALATHPLVIAHAPRQDLALLATRFGYPALDRGGRAPDSSVPASAMTGLVDTQLMAAFCGLGDQVGLAALVKDLVGVSLAKEQQWTAWERRPLTDAQLAYAAADVRHLPALYAKLADKLGPRLAWVREETAQIVVDALEAAAVTPETAWKNIGGLRGLDPAGQAAAVALATWRQRTAIELDKPLGQVLQEKLLVELARHRPTNAGAVRALKGVSPLARTRADEIVGVIAAARPVEALARPMQRSASARAQRWSETLLSIVSVIADETGISPRLLATRSDAEAFAHAVDDGGLDAVAELPAMRTWRYEVLGRVWHGWLAGMIAIVGDASSSQGDAPVAAMMLLER